MKFTNPKVPEGINVSRHNPLADLVMLTAGAVALFAALGFGALFLGAALARHMPVSWENALAATVFEAATNDDEMDDGETEDETAADQAVEAALQELADRLAPHIALPDGLTITVHYLSPEPGEDDPVNAFATLGGHVFFYRGLLARMPDENALAMVMAHEMAHAANRDAAANLGGMAMMQLVLAMVTGSAPGSLNDLIYGPNALLVLGFTRDAERRADHDALAAVAALYGHAAGADTIFRVFLEQAGRDEPPAFLSTHPLSADRIAAIRDLAQQRGWVLEGETTPLVGVLEALRSAP